MKINGKINQGADNTGEKQDFSQIETWSKLDFKNYFAQHFAEILRNKDAALQKITISKYAEILMEE